MQGTRNTKKIERLHRFSGGKHYKLLGDVKLAELES
jgi:hypothetical protein